MRSSSLEMKVTALTETNESSQCDVIFVNKFRNYPIPAFSYPPQPNEIPQFSYDQSKESREFATNWTNTFPFLAPKSVEEYSLPIFIFHQFSNHLSNLFFVFLHNPSLPFASILFTLHLPLFTFSPRLASLKFPSGLLLATLPLFFLYLVISSPFPPRLLRSFVFFFFCLIFLGVLSRCRFFRPLRLPSFLTSWLRANPRFRRGNTEEIEHRNEPIERSTQ